jgi:hypothetical protein
VFLFEANLAASWINRRPVNQILPLINDVLLSRNVVSCHSVNLSRQQPHFLRVSEKCSFGMFDSFNLYAMDQASGLFPAAQMFLFLILGIGPRAKKVGISSSTVRWRNIML